MIVQFEENPNVRTIDDCTPLAVAPDRTFNGGYVCYCVTVTMSRKRRDDAVIVNIRALIRRTRLLFYPYFFPAGKSRVTRFYVFVFAFFFFNITVQSVSSVRFAV